jgi:hypothetical protein
MSVDFLPSREAALVGWANNFVTLVAEKPTAFGLTEAQATALTTLNTNFVTAYNLCENGAGRSPANVQLKNDRKAALVSEVRKLVRIIQAFPGVSDVERQQLRITVPKNRSPIPVPQTAPQVTVTGARGRAVTIDIREPNTERRSKPAGTGTAAVLTFVGAVPPTDPALWKLEFVTTRTTAEVQFPYDLPAGSGVWVAAAWQNPRQERGPISVPVYYNFGGTVSLDNEATETNELKIAA